MRSFFAGIGLISFIVSWMMPDAPVSGKPVTLSSLKHFFSNKETLLFSVIGLYLCCSSKDERYLPWSIYPGTWGEVPSL
ncbi:hypothetical protein RCO48_23680 [Peribacillus frigoritolerans]|nr:hypothetical protein [Peribacillus frigoritolerans]